eukprot:4411015-Pyramimonas_sp.AAC.1
MLRAAQATGAGLAVVRAVECIVRVGAATAMWLDIDTLRGAIVGICVRNHLPAVPDFRVVILVFTTRFGSGNLARVDRVQTVRSGVRSQIGHLA